MPLSWTIATKSSSGPSSSLRRAKSRSAPVRQVVMSVTTIAAMSSGSQPPLTILVRLAAKKMTSRPTTTTPYATIFHIAQCHTRLASSRNSRLVSSSVPVTARP